MTTGLRLIHSVARRRCRRVPRLCELVEQAGGSSKVTTELVSVRAHTISRLGGVVHSGCCYAVLCCNWGLLDLARAAPVTMFTIFSVQIHLNPLSPPFFNFRTLFLPRLSWLNALSRCRMIGLDCCALYLLKLPVSRRASKVNVDIFDISPCLNYS